MPVVRISDDTWARLQQHARPFEDTPDDVIRKALSVLDGSMPSKKEIAAEGKTKAKPKKKLPQKFFREPLLLSLLALGGTAQASDIRQMMEPMVRKHLLEGDVEPVSTGEPRWWNAVCWERSELVKEQSFRSDSPRGVWELSEKGRELAKKIKHSE